ncbi:alpha/beta hydrolase [Polycladomyces subterraneus]|uniref:Alpha/beta hydrolase n=1 Tax=Polycladomyces subterraneus TaxID=1016997 RepID=A0ABT8IPN4_9BACL|nr:alpha/beta hydrolase [Polycladomyces subterraneus]MDN4594742.1 alpha/beta hydrolase [Polycladomyces subterraneus]
MAGAEMDDVWCRVIADRADCVVVNVDYRLAPEHKFPTAALEEGYGVIKWMYDQPEQLGINRERVAVGGHSAGGNLAAAICLLTRERNEFPIALQILDYPPLDLATDHNEKTTHPQAIPPWLAAIFNDCYLTSPEQARNPLASPIYAESLAGLPSALIITGIRFSCPGSRAVCAAAKGSRHSSESQTVRRRRSRVHTLQPVGSGGRCLGIHNHPFTASLWRVKAQILFLYALYLSACRGNDPIKEHE